ncbi:hypothetical protein ACFY1U_30535 [Streptomyces sp. NPDC001351]|uniref:hypothetical protein n=1 Tax=Streptomyces sp. NPDC001351 TaxID=3364564 RepID=UPI00367C1378
MAHHRRSKTALAIAVPLILAATGAVGHGLLPGTQPKASAATRARVPRAATGLT